MLPSFRLHMKCPRRHSREGGNPNEQPLAQSSWMIAWIPAFAGMTECLGYSEKVSFLEPNDAVERK
jgi:hypothetical protein